MPDKPETPQAEQPLRDRVQAVIERIRPILQMDGGDIQLVNVGDDGVVQVKLRGACAGCPSAQMTLKMGVERSLRERIPEITDVVAV